MPTDIGITAADVIRALEMPGITQHRVGFAEGNHVTREAVQARVLVEQSPIEPIEFVVVTVRVVVAELRAAHLIAHQQHGHTLAGQQDGDGVFHLPLTQLVDRRIVGVPFPPVVPAVVVVGAIVVVLAVGLVVFGVVRHEIAKREPVVAGDEVD
jgi:hypothetical protein